MNHLLTTLLLFVLLPSVYAQDHFENKVKKLSASEWNYLKSSTLLTELDSSLHGKTILLHSYSAKSEYNKFSLGQQFGKFDPSEKTKQFFSLFNNALTTSDLPVEHEIRSYDYSKIQNPEQYLFLSFLHKLSDDEIVLWHVDNEGIEKPIFSYYCSGLDMSIQKNIDLFASHLKAALFSNLDREIIRLSRRSMQMSTRNLEFIKKADLQNRPDVLEIGGLTIVNARFQDNEENYAAYLNETAETFQASALKLGEKPYKSLMTLLSENTLQLEKETFLRCKKRKFNWLHSKIGNVGTLVFEETRNKHFSIINLKDLNSGSVMYTFAAAGIKNEFNMLMMFDSHIRQLNSQYSTDQTIRVNLNSITVDSTITIPNNEFVDISLNSIPFHGVNPDYEIERAVNKTNNDQFILLKSDTTLSTSRFKLFLIRKIQYVSSPLWDLTLEPDDYPFAENEVRTRIPRVIPIPSYCPVIYDWDLNKYFQITEQYTGIDEAILKVHQLLDE